MKSCANILLQTMGPGISCPPPPLPVPGRNSSERERDTLFTEQGRFESPTKHTNTSTSPSIEMLERFFMIKSLMLVVFSILMMISLVMMLVMFQWRLEQGINIRANKLIIEELMC